MKLHRRTLGKLAQMICGADGLGGGDFEWNHFRYRTSYYLTRFFEDCDLDFQHDGTTREAWVIGVLKKLNSGAASIPDLPPDNLILVLQELLDSEHFENEESRLAALADVNTVIKRDGLEVLIDPTGRAQVYQLEGVADSTSLQRAVREWTPEEREKLRRLEAFLDGASEDDFTGRALVPLFSKLNFHRISVAGHEDKALEFGTDLWMKFRLPTGHFLYFGVQVKKGKLDSAGSSKGERSNIAVVLNQVRMMLGHNILDPELNRHVLVDHVFIVASGDITKAARQWLGAQLDQKKRRHIIFMDRDEILDLAIKAGIPVPELAPF